MRIDGWDIPTNANYVYSVRWNEVLGLGSWCGHIFEYWVKVAEDLATQHNGLPPVRWLKSNGYDNLYRTSLGYPELFIHIARQPALRSLRPKKNLKSLDEWVAISLDVARDHDGIVPSKRRLNHLGLEGLYKVMKKNPAAFPPQIYNPNWNLDPS